MNEITLEDMSQKLQEHLTQEQADTLLGIAIMTAGLPVKDSYNAEETDRLRSELAELGTYLTALLDPAKANA